MKFHHWIGAGLLLTASLSHAEPLFYSSVNSNDIDYIRAEDPSTFLCMASLGKAPREMVSKDDFAVTEAYVFDMHFSDGVVVPIWVHPDVGDQEVAAEEAGQFAGPLGKLPTPMRKGLDHVVLNAGDDTPFSESEGRFIILGVETVRAPRAAHDMEETVFHEAVHASLDIPYATSEGRVRAQQADGDFMTAYGAENPDREDFAETALMAYTYYRHPDRLGAVKAQMEARIPHRLKYFGATFYGNGEPDFYKIAEAKRCG